MRRPSQSPSSHEPSEIQEFCSTVLDGRAESCSGARIGDLELAESDQVSKSLAFLLQGRCTAAGSMSSIVEAKITFRRNHG